MEGAENEKALLGSARVKTPGKIIISGEHSVVYRKPALVMAINLYTYATVRVTKENNGSEKTSLRIVLKQEKSDDLICSHQIDISSYKQAPLLEEQSSKEIKLIEYIVADNFDDLSKILHGQYILEVSIES